MLKHRLGCPELITIHLWVLACTEDRQKLPHGQPGRHDLVLGPRAPVFGARVPVFELKIMDFTFLVDSSSR